MMSRHRLARTAVLAAFGTPLAACFSYIVTPPGTPVPTDADVHVAIAPAATERVTALLGPRVQTLDGRVVSETDSVLTLSVRAIMRSGGSEEQWNGDAVAVPRSAITSIERRRFDGLKTGLIAGGLVGAAIIAGRGGTSSPTTLIRGGSSGSGQ